jgi:choline kinase
MQAIIMAAGIGSRLKGLTQDLPKPLIQVKGVPMLGRKLINILRIQEISEVIIVTGYLHEQIEEYVKTNFPNKRIRLVYNEEYMQGSVLTLLKAVPFIKEGFLLLNSDHLFSTKAYVNVIKNVKGIGVCSFRNRKPFDDEMKIKVNENGWVELSKTHSSYDSGYTGLTAISDEVYKNYLACAQERFQTVGKHIVPESLILPLCKLGVPVFEYDLSGHSFVEVDNLEDLEIAHHRIKLIEAEDNWQPHE